MYPINGKLIESARFASLEPMCILNYYDGPRIFTFLDGDEALCLACWSDEDENYTRFIVAPTTSDIIEALHGQKITVREALDQPRVWIVDEAASPSDRRAYLVSLNDIPEDAKPDQHAYLHAPSESITSPAAYAGEQPQKIRLSGVIRAVDERLQQFQLHESTHSPMYIRTCYFDAIYWDDVYRVFGTHKKVYIEGIEQSPHGMIYLKDLSETAEVDVPSLPSNR